MNKVQLEYLQVTTEWETYLESLKGENAEQLVNEEYEDQMIERIMDAETNIINWVVSRAHEVKRFDMTAEKLEYIATNNNEKFKELVLRLN